MALPQDDPAKRLLTEATAATQAADPGAALGAALAASYATRGQLSKSNPFNTLATLDRETSSAASRVRWEDATEWTDRWTDLASWQARDLQVSAGKLYRATAPVDTNIGTGGLGVRALANVGTSGDIRIRSSFTLPAAGAAGGFAIIGTWAGDSTVPPATLGAAGLGFGVGFRETNVPIFRNGDSGGVSDLGAALPAGTYTCTVTADAYGISVSIEDSTGNIKASGFYPLASRAAITGAFVMNTDTRHTAGTAIGAVNARAAITTATTRAGIEGSGPWLHRTQTPAADAKQDTRICLPANYDSRKPVPLVLYSHARSGTSGDPWIGANPGGPLELTNALTNAGYAVASNNQHGNNWGNQAAVNDLFETYKRFRDMHNLGPVVILAQSMGGMSAMNAIIQKRIPGIRGFYGIFPATNLAAIYAAGQFAADIRTAYGISADGSDYAAKTAGMDPALREGWEFQGVPMRFHHSPADTLVGKGSNSDMIAAKVLPYTSEAVVITTTGEHGDPSNFNDTDMLAFFNRCISAV